VEEATEEKAQVNGTIVRSITTIKAGETVKLVQKDHRGQVRHWLWLTVREITNPAQP
jgi:hypothetical protein